LLAVSAAALSCPLVLPAGAAAAAGSAGTAFWLGFPAAFQPSMSPQHVLQLTASARATGTVSIPGTGFSQAFTVKPGAKTDVILPPSSEDTVNDAVVIGQGIHVVANRSVSVDAMYEEPGLSDGYLGLPTSLLGRNYLVAALSGDADCGNSEFQIVGTQAATTVSITPSTAIGSHAAGVTYTEELGAGAVYLGQAAGTDTVTGSRIVADKPVAVLTGSSCAEVPATVPFANALMEQEPPVSAWGTSFFTLPFATRTAGDEYMIVASQANTTVTRNGTFLVTIGTGGGSSTQTITDASQITANKPILLVHLATGGEYMSDGNGDPTMIVVPPSSRYTRIQTVGTPLGFAHSYLNITISNSDLRTLTLDGKHVTASLFHLVGNSSTESGAQVSVSAGAHALVAAGPFGAEAYGFDPPSADAYGFPGAFGVPARAAAPVISIKTPRKGATYKKGQVVRAAYACAAAFGTTIRSCAGPVANGARISTSTAGVHTFTVKASDYYGGHSSRTVTYRIHAG
jgi:IgGFc binding protein